MVGSMVRTRGAALLRASVLTLALTLVGAPVRAQAPDTVEITGRVVDSETGEGLVGAVLELSGVRARYVTDESGEVTFGAAVGDYILIIQRGGYATLQGDFQVIRSGGITLGLSPEELGDPTAPGRLVGTVTDAQTGLGVEGVEVSLLGRGRAVTNANGRFRFDEVLPGLAEVTISRLGYAERREPVTIHAGRTTAMEVGMAVEAIALEPIQVEVRSRFLELNGVYRRMEQGVSSRILTRREIEQQASARFSDSLNGIPGLRVDNTGQRRELRGRGNCPIAVYVDGIEWGVDIEGSVDIDQIPPHWVELAEVYTGVSAVPQEYNRGHGCGVMLIWTRQGADRGP